MTELEMSAAPRLEALGEGKSSTLTRRSRRGGVARGILPPLVAFGCFVGVAYLFSYVFLSPSRRFLMPPPDEVVRNGLFNNQHLHEQLSALWTRRRCRSPAWRSRSRSAPPWRS